MTYSIAKRYVQAVFNLSQENDTCESVYKDLKTIYQLIDESEDLREFLSSPIISSEKRQTILKNIFENKINPFTYSFICFLDSKNRLDLLEDACDIFAKLYFDAQGICEVAITSNAILDNEQVKEISKHLKSRLKKEIKPSVYADATMLGGVKIQDGDTIYDYSFRTQLEQFRKNLLKA